MWRISSLLVSLCLILVLHGVYTEEPEFKPSENDVESSSTQGQTAYLDDSSDSSTDPHTLPEAPFPITTQQEDADLVPATPTLNNVVVVGGGMGGAAAAISLPDIEDVSSMDSVDENLESPGDTSGVDGLPKAVPTHEHVLRTTEEKKDPIIITEASPPETQSTAADGKDTTVADAGVNVPSTPGVAQDTIGSKVIRLPAATQTLDDFLQTEVFETHKLTRPHPSSEVDPSVYDPLQATESLKSVSPGTWEGLSKLPIGVGGMAVEPQYMQEAVVSTQFRISGEKLGTDQSDEVGEDGKKKGEEEFPTFDKWSVQYLAEQEKQKIEKEQEHAINPGTVVAQKKLRQNFAAASCGAKVVASNAEAENINFLLNGNPDEYMLSPCKAKKWFVVELCEPLQIHKVELGALEMFSSQPKSFRVFASQRYPSKDWTALGKFEMTPERTVQSFHTQLNEEFVKFVKVEMLEHHGDEHYCPITTFRVLGIDMASDEEDESDHETVEPDGETAMENLEDDEVEGSVNLFTSAKETVVKLMKKVLYKGDQDAQPEEEEDNEKEHLSADNATTKSDEKKGEVGDAPCPEKNGHSSASGPTVQIPEAGVISPPGASKEPEEVPFVTKLAPTDQLPMDTTKSPVVIKLEPENGAAATGQGKDEANVCYLPPLYSRMIALKLLKASTCMIRPKTALVEEMASAEVEPALTVEIQSTSLHEGSPMSQVPAKTDEQEKKVDTPSSVLRDITSGSSEAGDRSDADYQASQVPVQGEVDKSLDDKQDKQAPVQKEAKILPTEDQHPSHQLEDSVASSQSTSFTPADVSSTKSETLEPSSLSRHADLGNEAASMITPGLDIQQSQVVEQEATDITDTIFLKVSPSPTLSSEDSMEGGEMLLSEAPTAVDTQEEFHMEDTPQLPVEHDAMLRNGNGHDINSEDPNLKDHEPTKAQKEGINGTGGASAPSNGKAAKPELVKVGMPSTAKRDTSLMKLNNRIMALEQNVSMTKKYLEELSRAFKQQNEEMMKLLNKTEMRLSLYMAQADERELRQEARIAVLEQKVANLTQVVDTMQLKMDAMNKELRDGQLLLVFFQVLLFLWMMISSYRNRFNPGLTYSDHQFLLDTMPLKPTFESSSKGVRQRRNSDVGIKTITEQAGTTMKRQRSETNLAAPKEKEVVDGGSMLTHGPFQASKKKKKKKLKHPQFSMDSVSSLSTSSTSGSVPIQSSSFSSSAGVLFGTGGSSQQKDFRMGDPKEEWLNTEKENLFSSQGTNQPLGLQDSGVHIDQNQIRSGMLDFNMRPIMLKNGHGASDVSYVHVPHVQDRTVLSICGSAPEQNNWHCCKCDAQLSFTLSKSPLKEKPVMEVARENSPEFKLPPYHRHKIRRVGEGSFSNSSGVSLRFGRGKNSNLDAFDSRRSTDFLNPVAGEELFLAENYLSENRFKFPVTSPLNSSERLEHLSWTTLHEDEPCRGYAINGPIDERYPPMLSCSSNRVHVIPTTSPSGLLNRSSSPLSSLSTFSSTSSLSSGCHPRPSAGSTVAYIPPQDRSTVHPSFIATPPLRPSPPPRPPLPLSLSQLSSQSLPQMSRGSVKISHQPHHHQHQHHQQPCHPVAQAVEPGSVIASAISQPTEMTKGDSAQRSGGNDHEKPASLQQTHRRQGSYPLNPQRVSKSMEKEPGRARQGSFEGPKHMGKGNTGQQQGPKVKKSPSNPSLLSRKGSGSKNIASDKTTANHTSNKKGPKP